MFAVVEPGTHHHDILVRRVGASQNISQIVEILGIAHRHQDIAWPDAECTTSQFLVSVDPELPKAFRLALALARNSTFRIGEEGEENNAECDAGDSRLILGEQVDYRRRKQHGSNHE